MNTWLKISYLLVGGLAVLAAVRVLARIVTGSGADFMYESIMLLVLLIPGVIFTLWGLDILKPNKFSHISLLLMVVLSALFQYADQKMGMDGMIYLYPIFLLFLAFVPLFVIALMRSIKIAKEGR